MDDTNVSYPFYIMIMLFLQKKRKFGGRGPNAGCASLAEAAWTGSTVADGAVRERVLRGGGEKICEVTAEVGTSDLWLRLNLWIFTSATKRFLFCMR